MMTHPHETPFKYDNALLVSCANSPLAQSLISPMEMASSALSPHLGNTSDCLELLNQHASHYNRAPLSAAEIQFWHLWTSTDEQNSQAAANNESIHEIMSSRHTAFMQSVIFVHRHNTDANTVNNVQHKVALNRFSDVPSHEYPLPSKQYQQIIHHGGTFTDEPLMFDFDDPMFLHLNEEKDIMKIASKLQRVRSNEFSTTTETAAASSSTNNNHYLSSLVSNIIETIKDSWWWIGDGQLSSKSSSSSSSDTSGAEPNLKRHKEVKNGEKTTFVFDKQNELSGSNNDEDSGSSTNDEEFSTYLNWATKENPDGVPIVHPPIEQGSCGSCWAVSSLGTMEASIARNMAYMGYEAAYDEAVKLVQRHLDKEGEGGVVEDQMAVEEGSDEDVSSNKNDVEEIGDDVSSPSISFDESRTLAVLAAQQVERKSIELADLSVQELIDCDTRYDQGCGGGNPQMAYYYLHKHGVTSSKNYPYVGTQNVCKQYKVGKPIAKVESWGVLTPDHENNLEKVLRYIGPVAVGLGAYDAAFLSYSGGVFASTEGSRCNKLVADHAMLIVGYGEEVMSNGTKMKYWICRNSWGKGWGEGGYVKMARIGGKKGEKGICGISKSPSVALGGKFSDDVILDLDENELQSTYFGNRHDAGIKDDESTFVQASAVIGSIIHRVRIRLGFMQKGIEMYTLSGNDKNDSSSVTLLLLGVCFMVIGVLVIFDVHRKRCLAARKQRRNKKLTTQNSLSSTMSTMGVYHGVGGERRPLLQTNDPTHSVPIYTA